MGDPENYRKKQTANAEKGNNEGQIRGLRLRISDTRKQETKLESGGSVSGASVGRCQQKNDAADSSASRYQQLSTA